MIHIRTGYLGAAGVFRAFAPAETILSPVILPKITSSSPRYFTTTRSNYLSTPAFVTGIASKFRKDPPPTVAVLRLAGTIADGRGGPGSRRINDDSLSKQIEKAFEQKNLKAVCLRINSPGGSPVQSELIAKRIQRLSTKKEVPVYAFVEDVAASGGYFLACGAREIYVSESSIVGSIGVISQSFGFQEIIKRWGLENRLQTAGENKAIDNPFVEKSEAAVARTQRVLVAIHQHFISFVKASRGDRLKGEEGLLFSGEYWTGKEALDLGLVDGVETDMNGFLENKFGKDVKIVPTKKKGNLFEKLMNRDAKMETLAVRVTSEVMDQLDERLDQMYYGTKFN